MVTYLITGGAGFIGSHLAEKLIGEGSRVIVLDDLSSGRVENLAALVGRAEFTFAEGSVMDRRLLGDLVARADVVFHLAATVGVLNIIRSPVETITNNIDGTHAVLEAAVPRKTKVIVTSTSEVYGKSAEVPFREEADLLLGPTSRSRWSYGASKIIDEFLALAYWRECGVPTVVTRLFNTIGPRQTGKYGMVVPRFIRQAQAGENLTVYGDGRQSRAFTYVGDITEWLVRLASSEKSAGQIVNLGNTAECSIGDLARRVIAITGAAVGIDYVPYRAAYEAGFEDIERRLPDISKAIALTGYKPQVSLDEALRRTRDWCAENASS